MINAEYVYRKLDPLTRQEIRVVSLSPQFKLFLQTLKDDCNQQLSMLDAANPSKLAADYARIAIARDLYNDMLDLLTKLTTEKEQTR